MSFADGALFRIKYVAETLGVPVEDLAQLSVSELMEIKGLGKQSVKLLRMLFPNGSVAGGPIVLFSDGTLRAEMERRAKWNAANERNDRQGGDGHPCS